MSSQVSALQAVRQEPLSTTSWHFICRPLTTSSDSDYNVLKVKEPFVIKAIPWCFVNDENTLRSCFVYRSISSETISGIAFTEGLKQQPWMNTGGYRIGNSILTRPVDLMKNQS